MNDLISVLSSPIGWALITCWHLKQNCFKSGSTWSIISVINYLLYHSISSPCYCQSFFHPARRWSNVVLMLSQRLRRWPNINTALGQRIVFSGRPDFAVTDWQQSERQFPDRFIGGDSCQKATFPACKCQNTHQFRRRFVMFVIAYYVVIIFQGVSYNQIHKMSYIIPLILIRNMYACMYACLR